MIIVKQRLKKVMKKNGITQRELSDMSGIPEHCISRYVSGERVPHVKNLVKLTKALNTTTDYLVGLEEDLTEEA